MTFRRVASYIALHARRRPLYPAVMRNAVAVTYVELHRDLRAVTAALSDLGVAKGGMAAVSHADLYIHLLLLFGFESLGVQTGSFFPGEGVECHGMLDGADLVLTQAPLTGTTPAPVVMLTDAWVARALASAAAPPPATRAAAGDNMIMLRSSGTTGHAKRMSLTYAMMHERLRRQRESAAGSGINRGSRFLASMHFSVGSTYMAACNCLLLGATFMFDTTRDTATLLLDHAPTRMTILPLHLRRLLASLPSPASDGPMFPGLTIQTIGAKMPRDLRDLALATICGTLIENYGTNEAGSIGRVDDAGILTVANGVTVEIADDAGTLRVRGAGMVRGYIGDEETTRKMFRDGWFYPGDLAARTASGQLQLVGRRDDVLNLGGLKIACAELESKILDYPGLRDVALLQSAMLRAPSRLVVCVVADRNFATTDFGIAIEPMIDFPFIVRRVPKIPRTSGGKVKREQLRQALAVDAVSVIPAMAG